MQHTLSFLDLIVFALYFGITLGVGLCFTRQKSLKSYLLADQDTHFVVLAISIIAALFSGISFLGAPSETYNHDLQYTVVLAGFFVATPLTAIVFVPLFYKLKLYTAYEYLERRFDKRVRHLASILFVLRVSLWLAVATYAPALIVTEATGWPPWIPILLTGVLTTIYTCMGGMRAVIWTDALQFTVLVGGIIAVIGFAATKVTGGLPALWDAARQGGKTQLLDFRLDPTIRITFWAALLGGTVNVLVQMVTDQVSVQRYLSAPSIKECQRAMWLKLWLTLPIVSLFYLTGTLIYGFYHTGGRAAPILTNADSILPHFVIDNLPSPLPGLLIAAIMGATMSTVSAGINALTGTLLIDFVRDTESKINSSDGKESEEGNGRAIRQARGLTFALGLFVTVCALFIGKLGTLVEAPVKFSGLLGGPLLGAFLLGAFSRRVDSTSVLLGIAFGGVATYLASHFGFSFLWLGFAGTIVTLIAGHIAAFFLAHGYEPDEACLHRSGDADTAHVGEPSTQYALADVLSSPSGSEL
jgi:sodium-coupled monocarboxylate transporter 8/12